MRWRRRRPSEEERLLLDSPLFDEEWYAAQGFSGSRTEAVAHYLGTGRHIGRTPHPLFDPGEFARHRPTLLQPGDDSLVVYLRGRFFKAPVHPFLPMWEYLKNNPGCHEHEWGPIGHYLEHQPPPNDWYQPALDEPRGLVDWSLKHLGPLPVAEVGTDFDGTTVIVHCHDDWQDAPAAVASLLAGQTDPATWRILVHAANLPPASRAVVASLPQRYDVQLVARVPEVRGPVISMDSNVTIRQGLSDLVSALDEHPIAAPVLVRPTGSILSVGGSDLLSGHPIEDAETVADLEFSDAPFMAARRASSARSGPVRLVPSAWAVVTPWTRSGPDHEPLSGNALPNNARPRAERLQEGPPRLRWAIKNPAPFSEADSWGDTHFARQLARSLRRLGQDAVIDHKEEYDRTSGPADDVTLVLRGLWEHRTNPDQINLMWLISHPELVTDAELASYDRVYVASALFAESLADKGFPAHTLLQATDPAVFHPGLATPDTGAPILFVGNSRRVIRPYICAVGNAGLQLEVYGDHWEGLIPAECVRAKYLPNDRVGAAYRAAGLVLNDHWPDMAAQGFISNRIFDVVAAGGRMLTDDVPGIKELFGDLVLIAQTPEQMVQIASQGPPREPDEQARLAGARMVAAEHSFDVRAQTLLDAALEIRSRRADS